MGKVSLLENAAAGQPAALWRFPFPPSPEGGQKKQQKPLGQRGEEDEIDAAAKNFGCIEQDKHFLRSHRAG